MSASYEAVIGLEIHAQLLTKSKCFSTASTEFVSAHNQNVTWVCAGLPGTLPSLNQTAVDLAVRAATALGCEVQRRSRFARKQYFYPDMPKGYQISQYEEPIAFGGQVQFFLNGNLLTVELERAHLEEDAGKSTHHGQYTLVNLNRAGVPLLEIVSKPVMHSSQEAAAYARTVRQILQYAGVCDGNLEEGSLRCDCNVSVRPKGQTQLGTKVELKNINSFRFIEKAIDYEIQRQIQLLGMGETIIQETRLYDSTKNKTFSMRDKEEAKDYRYFPDPDLLLLELSESYLAQVQSQLSEGPTQRLQRFMDLYGLSGADAELLTSEKAMADFYEELVGLTRQPKLSCSWLTVEYLKLFNENNHMWSQPPISPKELAPLLLMVEKGRLSLKMAKEVFELMWKEGGSAEDIVQKKGFVQVQDSQQIALWVDKALADNPKMVAEYKSGKDKLFGFFVGQVMKMSAGQAQPELVNQLLKERLKS